MRGLSMAVGVLVVAFTSTAAAAGAPKPTRAPLVRAVDLNAGESEEVDLRNGTKAKVKLLEVQETRDQVCSAVRESRVRVEVNGQPVTLSCATYHLPVTVGAVQIDCPCTKSYRQDGKEDPWGLVKDARLRLWPADSPWTAPGTFVYPVKQRWFAGSTQMANEPVFVDGGDVPSSKRTYYHSGLDFGGAEGLIEVVAVADGLIVAAGKEALLDYRNAPVEPRSDVIYLLDAQGWYYRYSHLQTFDPAVRPGATVKMGQKIGILGKEGGSGGWSHLHLDILSLQPSGQWGGQDGYAYAWEAYRRQYEPKLIAVARPHRLAWAGQKVTLDGTRSWSASGKIARYDWTFTNGETASGATVEKTYPRPGSYSEILKVTDAAGQVDYDFAVVQVLDQQNPKRLPPTIHAAYAPTMGLRAGDPVTFKVRTFRTTAGQEVWNFGDGSPPVSVKSDGNVKPLAKDGYAITVHAFKEPGNYLVQVERVDDYGYRAIGHLRVAVGK